MLILVVEDEALARYALVDELKAAGHEVQEATNAAEAQELLTRLGNVNLLITDIRMPGNLDGLQLAAWARSSRMAKHIVLLTGSAERAAEAATESYTFLLKPYLLSDLNRLVRSLA